MNARVEVVDSLPFCDAVWLPDTQHWFQRIENGQYTALGFQLVEAPDRKWQPSSTTVAINGMGPEIEAADLRTLLAEFLLLMALEARVVLAIVPLATTPALWDCGFGVRSRAEDEDSQAGRRD